MNASSRIVAAGAGSSSSSKLPVEHVLPVGGQGDLEQRADEAAARLDQREQAARGGVEPLHRPLPVLNDLVDQPVVAVSPAGSRRRRRRRPRRPRSSAARCRSPARWSAAAGSRRRVRGSARGPCDAAPCACSSSTSAGTAVGPATDERRRAGAAVEVDAEVVVAGRVAVGRSGAAGSGPRRRRRDRAGATPRSRRAARRATASAKSRAFATSSTSRHCTARWPRMPSAVVEKTSARSRRTPRLSTSRVRPPVPGSTPSSGISGSETADELSSTSTIWSQASASS